MKTLKNIAALATAAAILPLAAFASVDDTNNPYANNANAAITSAPATAAEFDSATRQTQTFGGAALTNSSLDGALVLSQDRQLVGSVVSVFEDANGDLVASVAPSSRINTSANRTLLPVGTVNADGNVQLKGDFDAIRADIISEYGYAPQD